MFSFHDFGGLGDLHSALHQHALQLHNHLNHMIALQQQQQGFSIDQHPFDPFQMMNGLAFGHGQGQGHGGVQVVFFSAGAGPAAASFVFEEQLQAGEQKQNRVASQTAIDALEINTVSNTSTFSSLVLLNVFVFV